MIDLDKVFTIIQQVLNSEDGFCVDDKFCVIHGHTEIYLDSEEKYVKIRFSNNRPIVTVKKIIRLSLGLSGIDLKKDGGTLIIDNFPDIPFKYDWMDK
jgi:hypothetical protein